MQDIIDKIAADVGIDPALAEKATSMIADFIATQAPAGYVEQIKQYVPGFDQLIAQGAAHTEAAQAADAAASGGGLMGALGGLMSGGGGIAGALGGLMGGAQGGAMGAAMAMLGHLGKDGLDLGQVKQIATSLVAQLRTVAGDENVDKLISGIPGAGHLLG